VRSAADAVGERYIDLVSGAYHDAMVIGAQIQMGMIFVPSVGGVSHSPKELTHWDDCANGADVLLRTILEMDAVG
jgi:N-carbamoyl-L-amino-acid hydrolase